MPSNTNIRMNPHTGRPIVTPGTKKMTDAELADLVKGRFGGHEDKALAIIKRESNGYADVVVDTQGMSSTELHQYWGKAAGEEVSVGLFQINTLANRKYSVDELKDPDTNVSYAVELSNGGTNWHPWGG